ncbi:MAG: hypothetical protein UEY93_10740, partial [Acutalibacteraceae bacterium]|nr:hypothetical protein [Acutalibacteraceae bacterium]
LGLRRADSPTGAPEWIMRQIQIYQAITAAQILRYIKAAGAAKKFLPFLFIHILLSSELFR